MTDFATMLARRQKQQLEVGDPNAWASYEATQRRRFGPDPLAEGAQAWPAELTDATPGQGLVEIPADTPVRGWRMWFVTDDGYLVAPYLYVVTWRGGRTIPGVVWQPGVNENSYYTCDRFRLLEHPDVLPVHPAVRPCGCGIRAVQSLTVLRAYADSDPGGLRLPYAFAEVDVWGRSPARPTPTTGATRCAASTRGSSDRCT